MSARIVQRMGAGVRLRDFLLMHAMGANTAGQLGSVMGRRCGVGTAGRRCL